MLLAYKNKLGKSNVAQVAKPAREQKHYDTFVTYQNYDPDEQSRKADALIRLGQAKQQERLKNASIASNQSVEELKKEEHFKPLTQRLDRYFMGDSDKDKDDKIRRGVTPIQGVIPSMRIIQDYLKNLADNTEVLRTDAKSNILENLITISDKLEQSNSAVSDAILVLADSINNSTHLTNDTLKDIKESLNIIREEIKPTPSDYQFIESDLEHIENQLLEYGEEYTPEQFNVLLNGINAIKSTIEEYLSSDNLNKKDSDLLEDMLDKAQSLEDSIIHVIRRREQIDSEEYESDSDDEVQQEELQQQIDKRRYNELIDKVNDVAKSVNEERSLANLQKLKELLIPLSQELLAIAEEGLTEEDARIVELIDRMIENLENSIDAKIEEIAYEGEKEQRDHDERRRREEARETIKQPEFFEAKMTNLVKVEERALPDYPSRDKRIGKLFEEKRTVGQIHIEEIIDVFNKYESMIDLDKTNSIHPAYVIKSALDVLKSGVHQFGNVKESSVKTPSSALKNDYIYVFLDTLTHADKVFHGKKIIEVIEKLPVTLRGKDTQVMLNNIKMWMEENPDPKLNIIR